MGLQEMNFSKKVKPKKKKDFSTLLLPQKFPISPSLKRGDYHQKKILNK